MIKGKNFGDYSSQEEFQKIAWKNMKILIDKPLLQYTIETAKKSRFIDSILCSTDDEKILNFSKNMDAIL